jgi:hypothetical protein
MFVVAINVKHCLITLTQMSKHVKHRAAVSGQVTGYYTVSTGGLASPHKFGPGFTVQVRN